MAVIPVNTPQIQQAPMLTAGSSYFKSLSLSHFPIVIPILTFLPSTSLLQLSGTSFPPHFLPFPCAHKTSRRSPRVPTNVMALIDRLPQPLPLLHLISQKITFFKDDFRVENWILCGALLQSLLFYLHPHSSAAYIPLILLTIQQLWAFLIYTRVVPNRQSEGVLAGRVTAQVPNDDGTTNEEAGGKDIVVFVLGVRSTE